MASLSAQQSLVTDGSGALEPASPQRSRRSSDAAASPSTRRPPTPAASGTECAVKVVARCRPFNSKELAAAADEGTELTSIVFMKEGVVTVLDPEKEYQQKEAFQFDHALWSMPENQNQVSANQYADQEATYQVAGRPAVDCAMSGINICIFAYGQTGSGKTHSMLGSIDDPGISPRIVDDLFQEIDNLKRTSPGAKATIELSFLEIYNEKVKDLLLGTAAAAGFTPGTPAVHGSPSGGSHLQASPTSNFGGAGSHLQASPTSNFGGGSSFQSSASSNFGSAEKRKRRGSAAPAADDVYRECRVRQHPERGTFVEGLTMVEIHNQDQCNEIIRTGIEHRAVASTNMNATSSRSHAIFQLCVRIKDPTKGTQRTSVINLVDLAGSERIKMTGVTGQQLTEAKNINLSLGTLRRVIDTLIDNAKKKPGQKKQIPPYRESLVTWVLADSLGGSSQTIMVAAISPHYGSLEDTMGTLRYALKAKAIVCHVKVNEEKTAVVVGALKAEMERMRAQLAASEAAEQAEPTPEVQAMREELQRSEDEYKRAQKEHDENMEIQKQLEQEIVQKQQALQAIASSLAEKRVEAETAEGLRQEITMAIDAMHMQEGQIQEEHRMQEERLQQIKREQEDLLELEIQHKERQKMKEEAQEEHARQKEKDWAALFRQATKLKREYAEHQLAQAKNDDLKEKIRRLEMQHRQKDITLESAKQETEAVRTKLNDAEERHAALSKEMGDTVEAKTERIKALVASKRHAEEDIKAQKAATQRCGAEVSELAKKRGALQGKAHIRVSDLQGRKQAEEHELAQMTSRLRVAEAELTELEELMKNSLVASDRKDATVAALESESSVISERTDFLTKAVKEAVAENGRLHARLMDLEGGTSTVKEELSTADQSYKTLQANHDNIKKYIRYRFFPTPRSNNGQLPSPSSAGATLVRPEVPSIANLSIGGGRPTAEVPAEEQDAEANGDEADVGYYIDRDGDTLANKARMRFIAEMYNV